MSNLKNELIRLGNANPNLRKHITAILSKTAKRDVYSQYYNMVRDSLNSLEKKSQELLKELNNDLKKFDLGLSFTGRNYSWLNYTLHGSDGLVVGGVLYVMDYAEWPRSETELMEALDSVGIDGWGMKPKEPRLWEVSVGDSDRVW